MSVLGGLFAGPEVVDAVGDRAIVQAMLDAEAALARAGAAAGLIPGDLAAAIAAACDAGRFDLQALAAAAVGPGNPVVPLVRALTGAVGGAAAPHVHRGATSQDILDTALVLVARRALDPILADLDATADTAAALAHAHRGTVMAGRTLLQQAVPTTFGAKAAGWLVGLDQARVRLGTVRDGLPAQLGGAGGTLATLADGGVRVLEAYAADLGLAVPVVGWHTLRVPVADLAGALGTAAGILSKVATDLVLLAQTEVGEVTSGRGGSSTMPHKRNPVEAVLVRASARRAPGLVATLLAAMDQEHERAAGAWHAEWEPLRDLLGVTGGAAHHLRQALADMEVHPDRMRANLDAAGGRLSAEQVATRMAPALGRQAAHDLVAELTHRAADGARPFRDVLMADPRVTAVLGGDQVDDALDPASALGSAGAFVDRALAAHAAAAHAAAAHGPPGIADDGGEVGFVNDDERREAGMTVRRDVLGDAHVDRAVAGTTPFTADFQDLVTRYAWGEIWTRPGLDRRTRSCVTLAVLVTLRLHEELALHVRAALRNGLTPDEIVEVLLQTAVYAGVPAANAAFAVARRVIEEDGHGA